MKPTLSMLEQSLARLVLVIILALAAGPVSALAGEDASDDSSVKMEDIVVTAGKRVESIKDVDARTESKTEIVQDLRNLK